MQSSSTFIKISGPNPRIKKICIDQRLWRYYCLFRRVRAKQGVGEQIWFAANRKKLGSLRVSAFSGKFDYFYSHLSLKKVFSALKLIQNYFINVNIFFFLKTGNLILNWIPLSFSYNHPMPEKISSQFILPNFLVN